MHIPALLQFLKKLSEKYNRRSHVDNKPNYRVTSFIW